MQIWCLWCVWNNVLKPAVQSVIFVSIMRFPPPSPHHIIHCDLVSVCRLNVHLLQQKEQKKKTDGINLSNTQKTTTCHTSCTDALEPIVQPPVMYSFVCGQHEVNGSGSLHLETPRRNNKVILLKARLALLGKLCTPLIEILSPFPPPPPCCLYYHETHTRTHVCTQTQTHCRAEMRLKFSSRSVQKLRGNSPKARSHRDLNTLSDYFLLQINTGT